MSAALHRFGRAALLEAWPLETGEQPTIPELQIAGAIAAHESGYGTAAFFNEQTGEHISNTNNWGAVISGGSPPCAPGSFEATDTMPSKIAPDNPRGSYQACFLAPATPAEGARKFLHQVTTRRPDTWAAMKAGDIDGTTLAMSQRHGSVGAYFQANPVSYAAALDKIVPEIAAAMNEPVLAVRGGSGPSGSGLGGFGTWLEAGAWVTAAFGLGFAVRRYRERHGHAR